MATLRRVGSPLWAPHPDNKPQNEAFDSEADETLYGGAAGGGKSDLLLGTALTRHRKSIIFRRQQNDTKPLVERCEEIIGDFGRWSGKLHAYITRDDRQLEFGHCSRPGSEQSYQGRAHDLKAFDELAHFTEHQYVFLSGWNRTTDPKQRCRIIAASNPPLTAEGQWLIRRWGPWLDQHNPNPASPGELRWFAMIDGKDTEVAGPEPFDHTNERGETETIIPRSRTFIPAGLKDNPYYAKGGYAGVLQAFPEPIRSALLYGDFTGAMEDDPWQVIPTDWVNAAMVRWQEKPPGPMSAAGVDVARGGRARTVVVPRHSDWFGEPKEKPGTETSTGIQAAAFVTTVLRDGAPAQVDVIGVGASCYDQLVELGVPAAAMDAREGTSAKDKAGVLGFFNKRAEWWWNMREALDPETGDNLALPPLPELRADLCAPRWEPCPKGIKIEPKEAVEERLQRTVDVGDACVMALPQEVDPLKLARRKKGQRPGRANSQYQVHRLRG